MAAKKTFLILAEDLNQRDRFIKNVSVDESTAAETANSLREVIERILMGNVDGLILGLNTFEMQTLKTVGKLRAFSPHLSMIIASGSAVKEAVKAARRMKRVVVLEKPFDDRLLKSLCDKIKRGEEIYQRYHERFTAKQTATLHALLANKKPFVGVVRNISKGGAFIETGEIVTEGALFKLTITLDKIQKAHVMFGEVMRFSANAFGSGRHGLGLRFMDEAEALDLVDSKN